MEIAFYRNSFISNLDELVIPIQERGHQFGDGIYELIRFYNKKPFMLDEHLQRLQRSAEAISLVLPFTLEELIAIISEGVSRSGEENVDVYFQVTRGIAPRLHLYPNSPAIFSMTIKPSKQMDPMKKINGVSVLLLEDERWANCFIKSLNLLPNVMAKQKAMENGCEEAILIKANYITEGSSSNIFIVKDGHLYTTPSTKSILKGITRTAVFILADKLQIPVIEKHFTADFLMNADEAFITSTTAEILPIKSVDQSILPTHFSITRRLQDAYRDLTNNLS